VKTVSEENTKPALSLLRLVEIRDPENTGNSEVESNSVPELLSSFSGKPMILSGDTEASENTS
jgi:hypothetical protein